MVKMNKTTTKKLKKTKGKNISISPFFSARLTSIIVTILLLASIGYLYAKNQELEKSQQEQTLPPTPANLVTPTAQPEQPVKQKTNIIKDTTLPTPTPLPTERKKVAVTLTDVILSGTFYCYEDKANEIMTVQNNISLALKGQDICVFVGGQEIKSCLDKCSQASSECIAGCKSATDLNSCLSNCSSQNTACGDKCPKGDKCNSYLDDIDRLRGQLRQLKNSYCP